MRDCRCHGLNESCRYCDGRGVLDDPDDPHLVPAPRPLDADLSKSRSAARQQTQRSVLSGQSAPEQGTSKQPTRPPVVIRIEQLEEPTTPRQLSRMKTKRPKPRAPASPWREVYLRGRCTICGCAYSRRTIVEHLQHVHGVFAMWASKRDLLRPDRLSQRAATAKAKAKQDAQRKMEVLEKADESTRRNPGVKLSVQARKAAKAAAKAKRKEQHAAPPELPVGKTACPHCGKVVSTVGFADHMRDKHARPPAMTGDRSRGRDAQRGRGR